jgi:hypothetical protein
MTNETIVLILISVFTLLFGIIGWFIVNKLTGIAKDIKDLFKRTECIEKDVLEYKTEVAKTYMTKDDCDKKEKEKQNVEDRISEYRQRWEKSHGTT